MRISEILSGRWGKIALAVARNGEMPVSYFFDELNTADKAKIIALLRRAADIGQINNREKFKKVEDGLYEFKSFQVRIICFFAERTIVLVHGFVKKQDKIPPAEIERAKRIRNECQETTPAPRKGIRSVKGKTR